MFRVFFGFFGLVSIAAAVAVAPTATSVATPTSIPCTTDDYCKAIGFSTCLLGQSSWKLCKTDRECQNYDKTQLFCDNTFGTCSRRQCFMNEHCKKYNLVLCLENKCVGTQVADDTGSPTATSTTSPAPPTTPKTIPCTTDESCKTKGFLGCYALNG